MNSRVVVRAFSTKPTFTPEQSKAAVERVSRFKKFNAQSAHPTTFTYAQPVSGRDLNIPKNLRELSAVSAVPYDVYNRTAVISQRMNKGLQSGEKNLNQWVLTFESGERWSNPLMGWTSNRDALSNLRLAFDSKEEAIDYAQRMSYKYKVLEASDDHLLPPGINHYKDNFLPRRTHQFLQKYGIKWNNYELPSFGESHWFMPLKYHGDGVVRQHGPEVKK